MVRNFRGQVRISDVKEEFDNLTDHVNNMITTYNNAIGLESNIDYTKASSSIAPNGYTLTIGGLKKILEAYDGAVLGAQVYSAADKLYQVTDGIYITKNKVYRLKHGLLQGSGDILYYDLTNNAYTFGDKFIAGGEGSVSVVTKPFMLPTMTSNTSYGQITGGIGNTGDAIFGSTRKGLYAILNGESATIGPIVQSHTDDGLTYDLFEWTFQEPLQLTSISVKWYNQGANTIYIKSLDGEELTTQTSSVKAEWRTVSVDLSDNSKLYNGIKIQVLVPDQSGYVFLGLGDLKISAQSAQTIEIPAGEEQPVDKNNLIKVADLNTNRISPLANTPNFIAENIPNFKLGSKGVLVNYGDSSVSTLKNSEKGQFIGVFREPADGKTLNVNFLGEQIIHSYRREYNNAAFFGPLNRLFLPKGISNPYSGQQWQVCLDYTIERQEFEQT